MNIIKKIIKISDFYNIENLKVNYSKKFHQLINNLIKFKHNYLKIKDLV